MISLHSIPVERASRPVLPLRLERAIRAFNDYHHRPVVLLVHDNVAFNAAPVSAYNEDFLHPDPWPPHAITNWNHETAFSMTGWTEDIESDTVPFDWDTMILRVEEVEEV